MSVTKQFVRYVTQNIFGMLGISCYIIADTFFIAKAAGTDGITVLNLVLPIYNLIFAIGSMIGVGSATRFTILRAQGEERAHDYFSNAICFVWMIGILFTLAGIFIPDKIIALMGGDAGIVALGTGYTRIFLLFTPFFMMNYVIMAFVRNDNQPSLAMAGTLARSLSNKLFDYIFMYQLGMGLEGAALATAAGQALAAAASVVFFARSKTSRLRFTRPLADFRALGKTCVNGSSELMTEVAASVVSMLYNYQLMMIAGADGVAAYGVIMYVNFIFTAVFFGFAMGTGPVVSYHYGAKNQPELKGLFKKSMLLVGGTGAAMFAASQLLAAPLVGVFVGYDAELAAMTLHGFRIYAVAFLVCGFNIYGSAFFTALNNGKVSALISFMRTLVFETSTVMLLPIVWGIDGVWSAIIVAEACALVLTTAFLVGLRKPYGYA